MTCLSNKPNLSSIKIWRLQASRIKAQSKPDQWTFSRMQQPFSGTLELKKNRNSVELLTKKFLERVTREPANWINQLNETDHKVGSIEWNGLFGLRIKLQQRCRQSHRTNPMDVRSGLEKDEKINLKSLPNSWQSARDSWTRTPVDYNRC